MIVSDSSKTGSVSAQRQRSTIACQSCRQRKVRCDISTRNLACTNCVYDGSECQVVPRKRKQRPNNRLTRSSALHTPPRTEVSLVGYAVDSEATMERLDIDAPNESRPGDQSSNVSIHQAFAIPSVSANTPSGVSPDKSSPPPVEDEGENSAAFADALQRTTGETLTPFFVGDAHVVGLVYDMFLTDLDTPAGLTHFLVPHTKALQHHSEDLAYLRLKGALSMPSSDICNDLVRLYFHHVHAFLPIVDAENFLSRYMHTGLPKISGLLLWSMFFAASNFAGDELLRRAGYHSRKSWKRNLFRKAKAFYDMDWEDNKTTLIQSTILMSLWYSDTEDRIGSWHWMGVAISLSQTLGLYRYSETAKFSGGVHIGPTWLWRRIWWTCILRDRWLALGLGRPMRINMGDCDNPSPSMADMLVDFDRLQETAKARYVPREFPMIAEYWILMLKLSSSLGTILTLNYTPVEKATLVCEIEACERRLREVFDSSVILGRDRSQRSQFQMSQFQLFYEAALLALYRPYMSRSPVDLVGEADAWRLKMQGNIKAGAARINAALEAIIDMGMVDVLVPMSVTAIIPAMITHLKEMSASKSLALKLGKNKLEICLMVMEELRKTYWGADFAYKFFYHAQELNVLNGSESSSQNKRARKDAQPESSALPTRGQSPSQHDDITDFQGGKTTEAENISSCAILSEPFGMPTFHFDADFPADLTFLLSTADSESFSNDMWNPNLMAD